MPRTGPWASAGSEPSIDELLSDPIAHALMRADGLVVRDVRAMIDRVIRSRSAAPPQGPCWRETIGTLWRSLGDLDLQSCGLSVAGGVP